MLKDDDIPMWLAHLAGSPVAALIMLGLGVALVALAWRTVGNRRILLGAGAFVALAVAVNTVVLMGMKSGSRMHRDDYARSSIANHVALQAPTKIAGLMVPAGSVIEWSGDDHKTGKVTFAGPVNGAELSGSFDLGEFDWTGRLGSAHVIDGWPCAAGGISISVDGKLDGCTLASARTLAGVTIPAGSSPYRSRNNEYDQPILETKVKLTQKVLAPAIGVDLPADADVYFYDGGALGKVESGQWTVGVYGVDLGSVVRWHYPGLARGVAPPAGVAADWIEGDLYGAWQCGGRRLAPDTAVRLTRRGAVVLVKPEKDADGAPAAVGCVAVK